MLEGCKSLVLAEVSSEGVVYARHKPLIKYRSLGARSKITTMFMLCGNVQALLNNFPDKEGKLLDKA